MHMYGSIIHVCKCIDMQPYFFLSRFFRIRMRSVGETLLKNNRIINMNGWLVMSMLSGVTPEFLTLHGPGLLLVNHDIT